MRRIFRQAETVAVDGPESSLTMHVRVVPIDRLTPADLSRWAELQRADEQFHNPFFRPEFAVLVGQATGKTEVAVLAAAGETVGFFPFQREPGNLGRPVGAEIGDVQGIVLQAGVGVEIAPLMRACGLVSWTFDHLIASQACFAPYHESVEDAPYMDLSGGYEEYRLARLAAGSSVVRRADQRRRKLAQEVGAVRFVWHTDDPQVFATACRWKQEQIRHLHYPDIFQLPCVIDMLARLQRARDEAFQCVVSALYAGEVLVAAQVGVRSHEVLSACIPTFHSRYARYSPGMIFHLELARQANEHGVTRIDLGRGANQTKLSLGSASVPVALGAVDLRPLPRLARKAWYRLRDMVYATPLRHGPLRWFRRLRNRIQWSGS